MRIIPRDIGRSIEHFSFAFDAAGFLEALRSTLVDGQHRTLDAVATDGRRLQVRVLPYIGGSIPQRGVVVTFVDVTETVRQAERLQAIIDSLGPQIAVLDREGRIVMVNRAWRRFAEENGAAGLPSVEVGADYLATCATADGPDRQAAEHVATGLRRVLAGKLAEFTFEYPCHSPTEERWFKLQASPLPEALGGLVVSHVNITARLRAEQALEAIRGK